MSKRGFDLVLGAGLWVAWLAPALGRAIRERVRRGRWPWTLEERIGAGGRPFLLRVGPAGALQTWLLLTHVLQGHLSLVGPRPLTAAELSRAESLLAGASERLGVPPGWISPAGWAPSAASERLRLRLERSYARQRSLHDDLVLLWEAWRTR